MAPRSWPRRRRSSRDPAASPRQRSTAPPGAAIAERARGGPLDGLDANRHSIAPRHQIATKTFPLLPPRPILSPPLHLGLLDPAAPRAAGPAPVGPRARPHVHQARPGPMHLSGSDLVLSATDLAGYAACPQRTWLDRLKGARAGRAGLPGRPSARGAQAARHRPRAEAAREARGRGEARGTLRAAPEVGVVGKALLYATSVTVAVLGAAPAGSQAGFNPRMPSAESEVCDLAAMQGRTDSSWPGRSTFLATAEVEAGSYIVSCRPYGRNADS